jgi:hypothetical protein
MLAGGFPTSSVGRINLAIAASASAKSQPGRVFVTSNSQPPGLTSINLHIPEAPLKIQRKYSALPNFGLNAGAITSLTIN